MHPWQKNGIIPYLSMNKANYEVILLGESAEEEDQNNFQHTCSF